MATRTLINNCQQLAHLKPTARVFLQVTPRPCIHSPTVLDFLVPWSASYHVPSRKRVLGQILIDPPKRRITTTVKKQATVALYNPRKDDDGNDMSVEITPRASHRLKEIMTKDQNPNLALRITVESGGCHGFQYLMSLTTLPPLDSSANTITTPTSESKESLHSSPNTPAFEETKAKVEEIDEDDTVFAADDGSQAKVVMDGSSLELLKGSKIDYTMELIGSQFKIVDNPLATSSCGCGTSFDIKV